MAKSLKKTRLSGSKEYVPVEDGSRKEEFQRVVYVNADGRFYASFPAHLHNVAEIVAKGDVGESRNHSARTIAYSDGFVTKNTKELVIEDWGTLIWRVENYLINMNREKVIALQVEMNIRYQRSTGEHVNRKDVSFANTYPVVGIAFDVCYRCGDKLLKENNQYFKDLSLRNGDGVTVIPFTEERLAFLEHISEVLHKAARQLNEFELTLKSDPLQIDSIMKQGFLLEHKG